jgi:hypothetical protein
MGEDGFPNLIFLLSRENIGKEGKKDEKRDLCVGWVLRPGEPAWVAWPKGSSFDPCAGSATYKMDMASWQGPRAGSRMLEEVGPGR